MVVAVKQDRPAVGEMWLAVIAEELIYANIRLRLTVNLTNKVLLTT